MSTFTPDLTFGPYQAGFELDGGWNQRTIKRGSTAPSALTLLKGYTATLAVYDETDLSTMWQDRAGVATPAAIGQPLGKLMNVKTAASALHLSAGTLDTFRPTLTVNGSSFDGTGDRLSDPATSGLPASTTILALIKTSDSEGIIVSRNDLAAFIACWDGTGGSPHTGAGSPTIKVDGVPKATRLALQTAVATGTVHTILIEAANVSTWASLGFSNYAAGSFLVNGLIIPVAILDSGAGDYAAALSSASTWASELQTALGL